MGDDITIGVTEIVNNIEVAAQPNDQIIDISVTDNSDDVTLNITPTVVEVNINKGGSFAQWGNISGTLSDQTDLSNALSLKANLVGGKVPASELPSYVDDIVEVANYAALPATGETGKIYVTLDNNKIYRWSGSVYIEIASNNAIWGAITGTLSSQTDLQSALNAKVPTSRTITINGTAYDLSSDRSWSIPTHDAVTIGTANGLSLSTQVLSLGLASSSANGALSSTDWNTFNGKQTALSGTGFVKISGSTISYDNSTYVPTSRTLTINGTAYDLSADRSWTIAAGVWGSITGTLSSQTDLQTALNAKANDNAVVKLTTNQVIQGKKEFNLVYSGLNLSLITSDISSGGNNGMLRLYDNTTFNDLFVVESDGAVFAKSFIKSGGTSSQYLMADGSVSTGGGISGSGTTNYLPKFTGSTALGNSLIYDNGTNVGIGTTSPSAKLTILGSNSIGSSIPTNWAAISSGRFGMVNGNNSFYFDLNPAPYAELSTYNYSTGATFPLVLQGNGGNVGIGTTSPSYILDLAATSPRFRIKATSTGSSIIDIENGSGSFYIANDNSTGSDFGGSAYAGNIYKTGNYPIALWTNGAERMRVTGGGNVGIGTTSPQTKLDTLGVIRSSTTTFTSGGNIGKFGFGSPNYGDTLFAEVSSNFEGAGWYNGANLIFKTSSSGDITANASVERMRITSGGNVGIGTTSPSTICHLYKASYPVLTIQSSSYQSSLGIDTSSGTLVLNNESNGALAFNTNATERMRITSSGNVTCTGTVTATAGFFNSDMRLKDLTDYDYNVSDIKPISYYWKDKRDKKKHVGYSAQEVQKVMPDAVNEGADGFLSVNYVEVLVAKIAQMEKEIELLKSK